MCNPAWYSITFLLAVLVMGTRIQAQTLENRPAQELASKVLNDLYRKAGYPDVDLPKVLVVHSESFGAVYHPIKNEIHLEHSLLNICREFGRDSLNALTFILAHELSHAILKQEGQRNPSNFLRVQIDAAAKWEEERNADVYGMLIASLAGYSPEKVLDDLIDKIYLQYKLSDFSGSAYPSKVERKKSDAALLDLVQPLIRLFDAANLLSIKKEFALAALAYEHILRFYKGPELYNNLGVAYTLKAMEYFDEQIDGYSYPIEMDFNTGLKKVKKSRGVLTEEMRMERRLALRKAAGYLDEALKINPRYTFAHTNRMCVLLLSGEAAQTIAYMERQSKIDPQFAKDPDHRQILAIAHAISGSNKAQALFKSLLHTGPEKSRLFARNNLQTFEKRNRSKTASGRPVEDCSMLESAASVKTRWTRSVAEKRYPLGGEGSTISFSYGDQPPLHWFHFYADDQPLLSIRRSAVGHEQASRTLSTRLSTTGPNLLWVQTSGGSYLACEPSDVLYLLGKNNRILEEIEWVCH